MIKFKDILTESMWTDSMLKKLSMATAQEKDSIRKQLKKETGWDDDDIDYSLKKVSQQITPSISQKQNWNEQKYKKWLKSMTGNTDIENSYDMALNAKHEPGLIDYVKMKIRKTGKNENPIERIKWDLENIWETIMIKFKDILTEEKKEVKLPSSLKRLMDEANKLILDATNNDWYAIEVDSTWESVYDFKPITVKGKYIHIEYTEPLDGNKKVKDKWEIDGYDGIENVRWVLKCLKKGYRQKDR